MAFISLILISNQRKSELFSRQATVRKFTLLSSIYGGACTTVLFGFEQFLGVFKKAIFEKKIIPFIRSFRTKTKREQTFVYAI